MNVSRSEAWFLHFMTVFVLVQEEKEQAEVKFTKLKLQAKAKMTALNKQLNELKGQEALNSSQVKRQADILVLF